MWLRIKVVFCFLPWRMFCRLSCLFFFGCFFHERAMKKGDYFLNNHHFFCKSMQTFKILQVSGVRGCFRWLFPQHYTHTQTPLTKTEGMVMRHVGWGVSSKTTSKVWFSIAMLFHWKDLFLSSIFIQLYQKSKYDQLGKKDNIKQQQGSGTHL